MRASLIETSSPSRRPTLDLSQLHTFLVVADTGSFTRAAEELGYCQSSVTTRIKALERELDVTLFDRCRFSRNIVLTDAGSRMRKHASRLLALAAETKKAFLNGEE